LQLAVGSHFMLPQDLIDVIKIVRVVVMFSKEFACSGKR
jgi:hypothetical protein